MTSNYEKLFADRGRYVTTPTEPIEFHFYHLARYWSRLVGFCRQNPQKPEGFIETDLGVCVLVGSEFANKLIDVNSPIYPQWKAYWKKWQSILHGRPVTLQDVELASKAFDDCTAVIKYDPWGKQHHKPVPFPTMKARRMSKLPRWMAGIYLVWSLFVYFGSLGSESHSWWPLFLYFIIWPISAAYEFVSALCVDRLIPDPRSAPQWVWSLNDCIGGAYYIIVGTMWIYFLGRVFKINF